MQNSAVVRWALLASVLALALLAAVLFWPGGAEEPAPQPVPPAPKKTVLLKATSSKRPLPQPRPAANPATAANRPGATVARQTPQGVNYLPQVVELAEELNVPSGSGKEDADALFNLLDVYRKMVGQGYPSGLNRDIVRQMQGDNPRKLAVLPASFPGLNANGEITDRWSTPYFFHNVSDTQVEIRSAGPDQKFWTEDDIAIPEEPIPIKAPVILPVRQGN